MDFFDVLTLLGGLSLFLFGMVFCYLIILDPAFEWLTDQAAGFATILPQADKWVDIEKCLWSMWANTTGFFGGPARSFDRKLLFDALGMEPDEEKLRYYGLLDALC